MSWRNRKMFDDLPQGIVSGLAPIPRYKEGGFVNPIDYRAGGTVDYPVGMEAGGFNFPLGVQEDSLKTSFDSAQRTQAAQIEMLQNKRNKAERKITADIEADNFVKNLMEEYMDGTKTAGDFIKEYGNVEDLKFRYIEKKYPDIYEEFYSLPFGARSKLNRATKTFDQAIGMEAGSLVPEVFESGDQQINEALNNMVSAMNPQTTKVPLPDVTDPAPKLESAVTDKAETDLEPTGKKEIFLDEVEKQRDLLQEAIKTFVQEKDITKDSMEQFTLELQSFTDKAEDLFKDTVRDAAQRLDVDIDITNITLMTDEFDQEMSTTFPEIEAVFSGTAEEPQAPLTMEKGGYVEEKTKQQEEIVKRLEEAYEEQLKIGDRGPLAGGTTYIDQIKERLDAARARLELFKQEGTTEQIIKEEIIGKSSETEISGGEGKDLEEKDLEEKDRVPSTGSTQLTLEERLTPYYDRLKNLQRNVTAAGLMSGKSKQGGLSGFFDVVGQAQGAGAKAGAAADELMIRALAGSKGQRDYLTESVVLNALKQAEASGIDDPAEISNMINTALAALKLSGS
jgi:hypothetical protein